MSFSKRPSSAKVAGLSEQAGLMKYISPHFYGNGWIFLVTGKVCFMHGWGQWQIFIINV